MVQSNMSVRWTQLLIAAALLGGALTIPAATPDIPFDRYQVILNRKPFGEAPPPPPPPAKPPPPKGDSFAKSLRLSMIIETDDGEMRVGFVDNRTQKSYSLLQGESVDGIELVSASFLDEEAVLKNGEEMALLKLSSGEFEEISQEQGRQKVEEQRASRQSYIERRRARLEQMRQAREQPPPEPKYTGEELAKHLQDYQMEVIRQGLPPLPIPLTPEQDDQLVAEGVLPPVQ